MTKLGNDYFNCSFNNEHLIFWQRYHFQPCRLYEDLQQHCWNLLFIKEGGGIELWKFAKKGGGQIFPIKREGLVKRGLFKKRGYHLISMVIFELNL